MKAILKLVVVLFACAVAAHGQVVPAATMGNAGLSYSFHYSQAAEFGRRYGDWQTARASANLTYSIPEESHPLQIGYAGGYGWTLTGHGYGNGFFQHFFISQGLIWDRWFVQISDNISYLPDAPTTGFSGVPGTGEPIGEPNPTPPTNESVLTENTHILNNMTNGSATHPLDAATTLKFGGGAGQMLFINSDGLDTDSLMANAGLSRRVNARNSLTGSYQFATYSFPGTGTRFDSNTIFFGGSRRWSPRLSTEVSAGPQFVLESSNSTASGSANVPVVPTSINVAVNASAAYQFHFLTANVSYSRGVNGGAGYLYGGRSDSVNGKLSREFGRNVSVGIDASYRRLSGLQNNGVTSSEYCGAQANRHFGRYLNLFANYTVQLQSTSSDLPANALNGSLQEISGGIGYSPRGFRIRH